MASGGKITLGLGFKIDKSGLEELKQQLIQIRAAASSAQIKGTLTKELEESAKAAEELGKILDHSWNAKLNQLDLNKFNTSIKSSYGNINKLKTQLEQSGNVGTIAYNRIASAVLNTNLQLKENSKLLDEIAVTMTNTVKWGITSGIFNRITDSIQEAWNYTKALDSSLNDIRIVTGKSSEEMTNFAIQANKAAKTLGAATKDYTNASLIYYQQGLSEEEVQARSETTLKAANVTGQAGDEVSEQLTAVWNGYKVSAQETELYIDKLAAVAAATAADLEELSTGMSKVASAANIMGVDIDQLNAQLATIVSVTRQAPESVGTALKTIYARMGDIKAGLDGEVTLDEYTSQMAEMGVNVLDANNNLRDMGTVIEEIGANWTSMSREQQISLSQIMAGTRQYNNLLSLFDNWDMYTDALNTSANAAGTLQEQQDIYMESTTAHLQRLSTEAERTYDILFDQDTVNGFADALSGALSIFNTFLAGLGGGVNDFVFFGSTIANIFSKQIGQGIERQIENIQMMKANLDALAIKQQIIDSHASQGDTTFGESVATATALEKEIQYAKQIAEVRQGLSSEEYNEYTNLQQEIGLLEVRIQAMQQYEAIAKQYNVKDISQEGFAKEIDKHSEIIKKIKTAIDETKHSVDEYNKSLERYNQLISGEDPHEDFEGEIQDLEAIISAEQSFLINRTKYMQDEALQQEIINKIKNNEKITEQDITNLIKNRIETRNKETKAVNDLKIATQGLEDAESGLYADAVLEQEAKERRLQQELENKNRQKRLSDTVQGLTSIISLTTSISGIVKTIGNESLTTGEKISQILTTILGSLPIILLNLQSIKTLLPNIIKLFTSAATAMGVTAGTLGLIIGGVVLAVTLLGAGIYGLVKAYNADADAAKKAAEAHRLTQEITEETTKTYEDLTGAIKKYSDAVKDMQDNTKDYEKSLKSANEAAMELIKNNPSLALQAKRNSEGLITFEDSLEEIEKQAQDRMYLANATESYAEVQKNEASLTNQKSQAIKDMGLDFWWSPEVIGTLDWLTDEQLQNILNTINESGGLTRADLENVIGSNNSLIDTLLETDNRQQLLELAETEKQLNATNKLLLDESLRNSLEQNDSYNQLSESEKNAVADIYGTGLTEEERLKIQKESEEQWYKDNNLFFGFSMGNEDDVHKAYAEARGWTVADDKLGDKAVYIDSEGNQQTVEDDAARAFLVQRDVANQLGEYNKESLPNIMSAIKKISDAGLDINEQVSKEILGFASKKDMDFKESEFSLGSYNVLQKALQDGSLLDSLGEVTAEEWKVLGYNNAEEYIEAIKNSLNNYDDKAGLKTSINRIAGVNENADNLRSGIQSGDIDYQNISENEDYKALLAQLEEIKTVYPEVAAAANILNETWLVGTQEYMEALEQVQDAIYKAEVTKLSDEANEKIDELIEHTSDGIVLGVDDSEFHDKIDELLDAEYAIDIAVHTEAEREFESIVNAIDNINEQAEKIGENFVVSASDVRELNNTFPGIIQNMKDLGDGTVQLNQEVVESAIGMAQAEVAADSEATIAKLQNQASLLRQKQVVYQNMANAASELAKMEVTTDDTAADQKAIISENLAKLKSLNDEIETQTEIDNDKLVADASNTNGEITAKNWSQAYQKAAQYSYQFASDAIANMKAASGQGSPTIGDYGVNWAGSTGKSSEAKTIEGTQSILEDTSGTNQTQWAELAQKYQMLADSSGAAANDIEGMIAGIGAYNIESLSGLNNIKKGKGSKDGSKKDPDLKDNLEDEKDIYHDINIILKQISTELDRLQTQEKKLVGQDLIDNLNEQWGRLQDTIDATNEKIKIARGEMSRLQGELGAKGVTFNPDGTIANYAAAYDQQLATVNAVINHYNSLSADAQEGYKDTVEQAEKNWEEFLNNISEYDELVSEMIPELEDEIQAAIDEQIEIQIEKFNMEIELRLDMAEAERDWNEFKKRIIDDIEDDDILGNASAKLLDYNSYYKEDGTGVIQKNTQHVNEIIEQLKSIEATGTSSIYGDNEAQALEDLKTYYEQLMSDLTDVHDLIDEIRESYLDMMDEAQDKFDEQVETYEYIRDLLTHDMDLITMVYGDEAYDKLVDFYEKQEDNYNKQLDFQRQQKDFWKAQMDSLEEGSDEWQKAKENWMSAVEEWNSLVEEAIENLQDKYLNAINNIFANLNDKVTGGLGLDYVEQEWDLINKNADQYLDTINAVFETQQLENKYLDAIDDTDNISAQRKLNDLMKEEIKALEQKDKLTQYDIDRANLKYEIALKQIALEEAQQTKSSMRLRRDSQGNYRYEFVADNDAIREAEDELSVLQNQLYNMDVEQYRSNLDQLYEIYVEWQEALAEAAQINDPEARAERELMINEQYGELINGIVEENEVIKTNLRESAFDELVNLHQMELEEVEALSQAEKDIMLEDMIPQWTSGVQTMADAFAGEGGFIPTCKDALNELDEATKDYEDSLVELQYQGGFTFNDIVAGENEAIYTAMGLLQVNNELINSYKAEFDALNAVLGQLDGLIGKYGAAQNAANAAAEAAYKYADALLAQFAAAQGSYTGKGYFYNSGGSSNRGTTTVPTQKNTSGSGGVDTTKNNNTTSTGVNGKSGTYAVFEEGGRIAGSVVLTNGQVTSSSGVMKLANQPRKVYLADGSYVGTFATGGYTGEWNSSEGKLAMLHQKELVLNQRDTENILGAVEIMRHVTNSIDNSIFARVADFTSGIGVAAPNLANEALEQNVHIEANFPNVQNSNEVEEALNNLVNIAAQRANRNNRN